MPTENPKISAYVPQIIYDRFKEFKEERNLSFSQAAIELFAEYFGIDLVENSIKEFPGGLPDRVNELEQIVADLKQSYVYLSNKVDSIQSTSNLPDARIFSNSVNLANLGVNSQVSASTNLASLSEKSFFTSPTNLISLSEGDFSTSSTNLTSLPESNIFTSPVNLSILSESKTTSNLSSEPLIETKLSHSSLKSEQRSGSLNSRIHQLEIVGSDNQIDSSPDSLLSNLEIKIKQSVLAQRFNTTEGYIQNSRSRYTTDEFTKWTTKKDPDKISWRLIKEGKKVYYSPTDDLSQEQKDNLQNWLSENQSTVD